MKQLKRYKYEHYAILCQLAYQRDAHREFDLSGYHFVELVDQSNKACVRVFWQNKKREVIVCFRGSHSLQDWLLNLCCFKTKKRYTSVCYSVHWGIDKLLSRRCRQHNSHEFKPLRLQLTNLLEQLVLQGKKMTFIGHSTGGAMAVLFAAEFERNQAKKTKRVVTFGQPAVGGRAFAQHYLLGRKTYRICCDIDIVTFLPPLPRYYAHVGKLLWLHDDIIYDDISSRRRLLMTLKTWLLGPISQHFMHKYIRHKGLFDEH